MYESEVRNNENIKKKQRDAINWVYDEIKWGFQSFEYSLLKTGLSIEKNTTAYYLKLHRW